MPLLEVGQRYHPNVSVWPEGLHVFGLSAQRMEVMVALGGVTDAEAAAFRDTTRPFEVGLASHGSVVILLARMPGVMDWSDAPYDARLMPADERGLPVIGHTLIQWLLVDAKTGILRGIRSATVTPQFTAQLHELLEGQAARPFRRATYDADVAAYQQRFTAQALVRRAWITEQAGITVPVTESMREAQADIADTLGLHDLIADERIREVVAEAIGRGEAHLEERDGEAWYVDPGFGPDVPVRLLGYDEDLGMVDRRQFPEKPKA
ncbi:hypothetical protein CBQ26_00445 [Deinococcus indicus]|uniref:Uncharacterized protein n=1 Tax=Deinococcus indicus TaxID=223556 RepID=A0A246BTG2_9DEIO|nr:hypothetical protein [Deinococcus indicus]OWL98961.1 hypothetical protein CBQ26_00445 [Deinococcus indicus]